MTVEHVAFCFHSNQKTNKKRKKLKKRLNNVIATKNLKQRQLSVSCEVLITGDARSQILSCAMQLLKLSYNIKIANFMSPKF